ncbi:multidrug ABC transporter ATP-binding protein [Wolbachia pipientis]|uniref:Multidrug ABC transporter ATP-binding protein n=1 Tax=Wolbachia pipientis TaxID=955 RepID=A0A1E7QL52_WOLPI|nr:ATP-binding cassette domain-containing protein [Wolbachia pipientis]OEY87202.1 multidrug ABC transporter ATP-binding protein [Wolbachia pipientis]
MLKPDTKQLSYYVKPYLFYFVIAFIAVLLSALSTLYFGQRLGKTIDTDISEHSLLTIISMVLTVALTSFTRLYFIGIGSEKVIAYMRYDLYSNIINLQPSFFENTSVQNVISALITDTSVLQSIMNSSMLTILRNVIVLIGSIIMLLYTNIQLTTYIAATIPLLLIVMIMFGSKVRSCSRFARDKLSELAELSEENLKFIVAIKSFALEENKKSFFEERLNLVSQSYIKLAFLRAVLVSTIIMCVISSLIILVFFGLREVLNSNLTAGALSSFIFYSILAAGAVNNLGDNISDLQKGRGIIERVLEFINIKDNITYGSINICNVQKGISFNDVTFRYLDQPALTKLSFQIDKGQSLLIVGPSGSGKSTILKLLLRFYDPDEGSITIDGYDIRSLALSNLRLLFGLVPQDHMIFSSSIMENILCGKPDANYDEVKQAAVNAYAMEFIEKLPDQFNTLVGKNGSKLSEGQKQRIIIARAILKNPEILILDEATSALDYESENFVQKALNNLMRNRTTIFITHRLSTAPKTDKIIVMNNGKIEEIGTHDTLVIQDGLYAKLIKICIS